MKAKFKILKASVVAALALFISFSSQAQEDTVKGVAEKFVKSADMQDPDLLASVLHADAKQFVLFGPNVLQSTASEYIEQIRAKKLGGKNREITYENVLLEGDDVAMVKLRAVGGGLIFSYQLTMFKLENVWKIVTITTKATKA